MSILPFSIDDTYQDENLYLAINSQNDATANFLAQNDPFEDNTESFTAASSAETDVTDESDDIDKMLLSLNESFIDQLPHEIILHINKIITKTI